MTEETTEIQQRPSKPIPGGLAIAILYIVLTWAGLFAVRLYAPPDIMDNDQERPAAYAMDAFLNGEWIVQRDIAGQITSKPPLYTWTVALLAKSLGGLNDFTLYLPGALFVLTVALVILGVGRIFFRPPAGFLAAIAWVLSYPGFKQVHLARTDALFALTVFVSALLAFHAWRRKGDWTLFWFVAALATLTKGPLVLILVLGGMIPLFLSGRDVLQEKEGAPSFLRRHLPGLIIYTVLCAGWFLASYMVAGDALTKKMVGDELVGHATSGSQAEGFVSRYMSPLFYFLQRFAPWSLLALIALVRLIVKPSPTRSVRLLERFLAGYLVVGLVIFSLAPHQRFDHQFPLIAGAALLAGCELARWLSPFWVRRFVMFYPLALILILGGMAIILHFDRFLEVNRSIISREVASELDETFGAQYPIMHSDSTMTVQYYLGVMRPRVTAEQAIEALESTDRAAFVLIRHDDDFANLEPWKNPKSKNVVRVWDENPADLPKVDNPFLRLISNRPLFEPADRVVFFQDDLKIEADYLKLTSMTRKSFNFIALKPDYFLRITNRSDTARSVRVNIMMDQLGREEKDTLQPRETMEVGRKF